MSETYVTFEMLYNKYHTEKKIEYLNLIPDDFYEQSILYLVMLININEDSGTINSTKRLITDLFGCREKKVLRLASMSLQANTKEVFTQNMIEPERKLYDQVRAILDEQRKTRLIDPLKQKLSVK